jgi:hypothetical protein
VFSVFTHIYHDYAYPLTKRGFFCPDRIEDGDTDEEWIGTHNVDGKAVEYPLDPTRWWPHAGMLDDKLDETGGRCYSSMYHALSSMSETVKD